MMLKIFLVWVVLGVLTYGMSFAYWQREYPTLAEKDMNGDIKFSIFWGLLAPLSIIVIFINGSYKHGLKFKWEKRK